VLVSAPPEVVSVEFSDEEGRQLGRLTSSPGTISTTNTRSTAATQGMMSWNRDSRDEIATGDSVS